MNSATRFCFTRLVYNLKILLLTIHNNFTPGIYFAMLDYNLACLQSEILYMSKCASPPPYLEDL